MTTESDRPGRRMSSEIAEQPERLARMLEPAIRADFADLAHEINVDSRRFAVVAARGTSGHAAQYLKHLLEVKLGLPTVTASPSVSTLHDADQRLDGAVWIAISQSGGSPDLVEATRRARAGGALTIAITNTPGSALADAAHRTVDLGVGPELAVVATKTYTAELLACWLLVEAMSGGDGGAAQALPDRVADAVAGPGLGAVVERYRSASRLVLVGRGYSAPTAREGALKLMESAHLFAHAFSGADFLHGPIAVLDAGDPVLVVQSDGVGGRALEPVLDRLASIGADVTLVSPAPPATPGVTHIDCGGGLPEDLAAITQIVPLQRLALDLAVARGLDPDVPRGLAKVTRTL